ncbi:MAG: hypothetical protein DRP15_04155, partial [Candidatus Aenigmatarchaeota archaeon]
MSSPKAVRIRLRLPRAVPKKESGRPVTIRDVVYRFRKGYVLTHRKSIKTPDIPEIKKGIIYKPQIIVSTVSEKKREDRKILEDENKGIDLMAGGSVYKNTPFTFETKKPMYYVNVYYPLIPRFPKKGETVFAYANIRWDKKTAQLVYYVIEPKITELDKVIIGKTEKILEERLDVDFVKLGIVKAKELLRNEINSILSELQGTDENRKPILTYYIEKDILGLGKIEPLINDPNIEDISCDGVGIPIYVYHRDPRFGSLMTNIFFENKDELNSFMIRLAQKCRKSISIAEPLLDASLPDGSRVQATLGTDIARKGSNFTIRKFTEDPLTPTHMMKFGTMNSVQLAYLWLAVENGQSVLISGGTATGKTSLLNALSLFIRPSLKIVSIEDTPELRLSHPHWVPEVARTPLSIEGRKGEVSLFDLLKSSLRQRPDYIVMGEVRGKEAFVLFQQMATGHPSLATIHAASIEQLIDRLTTPPISLPPTLLENIDIIIFLALTRLKGNYVRRVNKILEVTGIKGDKPLTNRIFEWDALEDSFRLTGKSVILQRIAKRMGITEISVQEEVMRRKIVLEWMLEQNIFDYKEVTKIISTYYSNPEKIMDLV